MNRSSKTKTALALVFGWAMALFAAVSLAQEGHPLTGSWSGNRVVDGKNARILMVMELARDQTISGYVLEKGKKVPVEGVTVDPQTWTVKFSLAATEGAPHYTVEATFEDMGATDRQLVGKWTEGKASGVFSVRLN